jgi:peptidyl-tRNA hydrolase
VLGRWSIEEEKLLPELITTSVLAIEKIAQSGIDRAMNEYNK